MTKDIERVELELGQRFCFPADLAERQLSDGRTVIISPSVPTWVTLKNTLEAQVFWLLARGSSIEEVMGNPVFGSAPDDRQFANWCLENVLIEILVNNFHEPKPSRRTGGVTNLTVYLTDRCNLRCCHCYRYDHQVPRREELSSRTWCRVLDEFAALADSGGHVTFSGGEISLREDCAEILAHSARLGLKNTCLTNGTIWQEEAYRQMLPDIYELQVSLDGTDEVMNDAVRGDGTFAKVLDTFKIVARIADDVAPNLRLAVAMTFMPEEIEHASRSVVSFAEHLRVLTRSRVVFRVSSRLQEGRCQGALSGEAEEAYRQASLSIKTKLYRDAFWESRLFSASFAPFLQITNCGFGQSIGVMANGTVLACSESSDELIGSVRDSPLRVIRARLRDVFEDTQVDNMEDCRGCELKYICGGGCRVENRKLVGSYTSPSACRVDPAFKDRLLCFMADRREWSWGTTNSMEDQWQR